MADPLSLVALGAVVGGAASKFVEKAWDAGEKWLSSYFADHHETAVKTARANARSFLDELARRVKALEEAHAVSTETIATAQEHPGFSVALQKAMLTAAQTDDPKKHTLLARLIADRLRASPDGLLALAGKMACESIAYATPAQLRILGLEAALAYVGPRSELSQDAYSAWVTEHLQPFADLRIGALDLVHLEALSCLKVESFMGRDLAEILRKKNGDKFDAEAFFVSPLGTAIQHLWKEGGLEKVVLTSVGQIIGVYVSDLNSGVTTHFAGWD